MLYEFVDLSRVSQTFTESVIREMTRISKRHPGSINLAQGFPDFAAPAEIKQAAIKAIQEDINQYAITWGSKNLRDAIVEKVKQYNDLNLDPEKNVTVTCGSTEAMMATMKAIINPGDEIVIFEPFYENYGPDCRLSGATPRFVHLQPPDWSFDENELSNAFNEHTKAIIINTPNNPTGKVFSRKELEFIANLCQQHDCLAVTDEIYEHIIYDGTEHVSIASLPDMADRTVIINSISKTYSLTGWRVGWALASARITAEIKKVHDFLTVGAAAPLQEAAAFALKMPATYYTSLQSFYEQARDELYNALLNTPLHPFKPKGAYYIMCECTGFMQEKGLKTSLDLALYLIKNIGIATVPGSSFFGNAADGQYMTRFCFCKKLETLQAARERLKKV
jgi:aspartate/methionine/tyrosine aminotransferase